MLWGRKSLDIHIQKENPMLSITANLHEKEDEKKYIILLFHSYLLTFETFSRCFSADPQNKP